jgi:hypothetical protein
MSKNSALIRSLYQAFQPGDVKAILDNRDCGRSGSGSGRVPLSYPLQPRRFDVVGDADLRERWSERVS